MGTTSTMGMQALAPELITHVMTYLHFDDLLRCKRVCRKFKDIIEDSLRLRYAMELASCGMIDGNKPTSIADISLADRYTKLLLFDSTWRSLAWRKHEILRIRGATAMYDLYGGVLATGVPLEENRDRWKLEFRELDSLRRRGPNSDQVAHWSYEVALPLLEMALDPAQDLLILLAVSDGQSRRLTAHVRTLSGNISHPRARGSSHFQCIQDARSQNAFDRQLGPWIVVQILGRLVGILAFSNVQENSDANDEYEEVSAELAIWDWTTGQQVACISGLQGPVSFAFLNARYVMITRLGNSASPPLTPDQTADGESSSSSASDQLGSQRWDQRPQLSTHWTPQPSLDIFDLDQLDGNPRPGESAYCRRFLLPNVKVGAKVQAARIFSELSSIPSEASAPTDCPPLDLSGRTSNCGPNEGMRDNLRLSTEKLETFIRRDAAEIFDDNVPLSPIETNVHPRTTAAVGAGAPVPFTLSPKNRVFVVRLVLSKRQRRSVFHNIVGEDLQSPTQECAFFIPYSTLADHIETSAHPMSSSPVCVPWDTWGPDGTRLFLLNSPVDFFDMDHSFYPYGPRCVLPLRTQNDAETEGTRILGDIHVPSPRFRLRVIDVNQLSVRRFIHSRQMQGRKDKLRVTHGAHSTVCAVEKDTPTVVSRISSFFEEDVVTSLPYLETMTGEGVTFDCDTAMLTEDGLITVKTEDTHYAVQIYTF